MATTWWAAVSFVLLMNTSDSAISPKPKTSQLKCMSQVDLMTDAVRQSILNNLNYQRQLVAKSTEAGKFPVAFPMSDLQWDEKLAENANIDAMKCPFVPLISFNVTRIGSEKIGQAIALKIWDREAPASFTVDELLVRYSSPASRMSTEKITSLIRNYRSGDWDSGYQIIWEATKHVGCSYVSYKNGGSEMMDKVNEDSMMDTTSLSVNISFKAVVCNFSPAGCVEGDRVYRIRIEPKPHEPSTTTIGPASCSPVVVFGSPSASSLLLMHALNVLYYYKDE